MAAVLSNSASPSEPLDLVEAPLGQTPATTATIAIPSEEPKEVDVSSHSSPDIPMQPRNIFRIATILVTLFVSSDHHRWKWVGTASNTFRSVPCSSRHSTQRSSPLRYPPSAPILVQLRVIRGLALHMSLPPLPSAPSGRNCPTSGAGNHSCCSPSLSTLSAPSSVRSPTVWACSSSAVLFRASLAGAWALSSSLSFPTCSA